ncbi:MAG TPA: hypothetical protein VK939_17785 [Longimicrobiales bacterium]|nr:hypothetical protein [Longimicrobiales bacterium]
MRIFIYGMQNSGASLTTYLLGQVADAVVLVDLYSYEVMPAIDAPHAAHVIGKAVITTTHDLDDHFASFRPDRSILLLRDPAQNYVALSRKEYADNDGTLDEKFRRLEEVFRQRARFDLVLKYEDVVTDSEGVVQALRGIGFPASPELYAFPRSRDEITDFNLQHSAWCRERVGRGWSFGNIQGERMQQTLVHKLAPRHVHDAVERLCPGVVQFYASSATSARSATRVAGLLRDLLVRPVVTRAQALRRVARRLLDSAIRSVRAGARS